MATERQGVRMTDRQPNPDRIQQMMTGFWAAKALFTGVELGIFQELARGPASAEVLAYRLKLHPRALERLMNALTSLGLLSKDGNRFRNAPEAESYLVEGKPTYIGGQVEHLANLHWRLWQHLPDAIRENTPRVKQVFGAGFDIFRALYNDPQGLRAFVQGMHNLSLSAAEELVQAFDLTPYHTLMDVGGGSGALCIAAVKRYSNLKGIIFELPGVTTIVQDFIESQGVADRVRVHAGDFFEKASLPKEADVISLGWVLHDWPPHQGKAILRACYEALKPGGALMLCEKFLDEEKPGPAQSNLLDLHLLVSTGGEEHTASEYKAWMEAVGFQGIATHIMRGNRDLMVGHKR
ncbi:MAG: methyltransferase domain-containing protein [Dehalococcoidia bacterium]|nr:methyltransferase domain-containing protein [Dehalococcoidia bacterium]